MVQLKRGSKKWHRGEIFADEKTRSWHGIPASSRPGAVDSSRESADVDEEGESSDTRLADHEPQSGAPEGDTKDEVEDANLKVNEEWATHARM